MNQKPDTMVEIYTDGACKGNPGPGGWGALLRCLKRPCDIDIYTDSQYVQKGISEWITGWKARGWRTASKAPVKNADLWQMLDAEVARHRIQWHWVKGHAGHEFNERADELANRGVELVR